MDIGKDIAALGKLTVADLQEQYALVVGEEPRSRHRTYLIRRIAWRLQARAEGGLSERAVRRAAEIADDADIRVTPPKVPPPPTNVSGPLIMVRVPVVSDPRLPPPGTALCRKYRGRNIVVTVLGDGFEHDGERYDSLTAVARAISGTHVNGFRFFKLGEYA